ncbi:hypothetical protein CDV31_010088 [Fusarium ambrosium]|uniref:2EXR domain-containing protein n=1 Tax=Fusarium ambrosium TaxID=131363 RepID=A0A428TQS7_9HYPO|nr:hypothetical protein CDV31_010088 [Fusarium ambrosium]
MTTFYPFPRLPQEIRDLIWGKAAKIRTEKRDVVHFFTVFNGGKEEESAALAEYKLKGPRSSGSCLAAPRRNDGFSWTEGNKSMYLLDRGLWTACSDSRAAIIKTSLVSSDYVSSDETVNIQSKLYHGPRTAKFISEGQEQEMVVWTEKDLFILQPYDWKTLKWLKLQNTAIFPRHDDKPHLKHVAFELPRNEIINLRRFYDVEDHLDAPEPSTHPMIDRMQFLIGHGRFQQIKNVWLIDYGLKRRANPRPATRRQQFLANGFRFVEVTVDDGWTDLRGDDGTDALEFVEWVKEIWDRYSAYKKNWETEMTIIPGSEDYLVAYKEGAVKAYRNTIDNLGIVGTKDTSMRFADLTGDGKEEIWQEGVVVATGFGEPGSKI